MDAPTFSTEQKAKLTAIINEGMQVMHEVETLNAGFRTQSRPLLKK
jgi:hypothetical protein